MRRSAHRYLAALLTLACPFKMLADAQSAPDASVAELRARILALAREYAGQGDPDRTKQQSFEPLIAALLTANPQQPVAERLPRLAGVWRQVWGPYTYRGDDRGVDPALGTEEIFQVIFPAGYYYNIAPLYRGENRAKERIACLRGEYRIAPDNPTWLRVRFTRYPGADGRPSTPANLWELAPLAEQGKLPRPIAIVPTWIVRLFFGGGVLREVYTDDTLRLTYGSDDGSTARDYLYVLERVGHLP
jgi:hypothetical protein